MKPIYAELRNDPQGGFPEASIGANAFRYCRRGDVGSSCGSPVAERWFVRSGFCDVADLRYHASPTNQLQTIETDFYAIDLDP